MRILHTADWHLGRIFCGVRLTGDQEYMLEDLTDIVKEGGIDAVVIAGDVFDRAVPPVEAVNLLDDMLNRIVFGLKKPVVMISGNHDSPERLSFGKNFYRQHGLYVFGQAADRETVVLQDRYGEVAFCPIPYAEAPFVRDALGDEGITSHEAAMDALVNSALISAQQYRRKIAVAHTFVLGGEPGQSERPLSIGGATCVSPQLFSPFSCTLLGHLHRRQHVGEGMLYSGSILKYSFDEAAHQKSATIIEMNGDGQITTEIVELKPRRDTRCLRGKLEEILARADSTGREDYLKVTLTDEGAIYDAMGQLRKAYPNVLEIEREFVTAPGMVKGLTGDYRKYTDYELFCDFYAQVTGKPLGDAGQSALREVLEAYRRDKGAEA